MSDFRIGQGIDVHAFMRGRDLMLGGIKIPCEVGLVGHSDADPVLHALVDALLGATGQGDIGTRFPDTDDTWKGADSSIFVTQVWDDLQRCGWKLVNLDISLLAQKPRLAPFIASMREKIASLLGSGVDRVAIKATTTEHLGFVGREEGVLASAVVMLEKVG